MIVHASGATKRTSSRAAPPDPETLLMAIKGGRSETVRLLLDRGADAYARNHEALRSAIEKGHTDIEALLRAAITPRNAPKPPAPLPGGPG